MPRGTPILLAHEQRILDERLNTVYTPACTCGWRLEPMTLRDAQPLVEAHRLEAHPEIVPRKRRMRRRVYGQLQGMKSLDDNIAGARTQGAAGWAAPE